MPSSKASRAKGRDRARILLVDDDERNLLALVRSARGRCRSGLRDLGRRCAAHAADGRFRGHPARRLHAGHGRLRDRQPDPRAPADGADPDHLPVGGQQGDRASDEGLCDGRGRLCVQAGRPDDAASRRSACSSTSTTCACRSRKRAAPSRNCSTSRCAPTSRSSRPSARCAPPRSAIRWRSGRCRSSCSRATWRAR